MAEAIFDFTYDDNEFKKAIKAFHDLQRYLPKYIEKVITRFAGTFRRNVYRAIVKSAGWASKAWQPLSARYVSAKGHGRFWYRTGFFQRNLQANANVLRLKNYSGTPGEIQYNLLEGLVKFVWYPKNKSYPVSTYDVFNWMEYGTKRMPARPVINPAFWRTLQMVDIGEELIKIVDRKTKALV